MSVMCPACRDTELRFHGLLEEASFEPRWGFFGRPVLRRRIRAAEVSCGKCFRTFVIRPEGVTESPVQTINEMLTAGRMAASNGGKGPSNERADNTPRPKGPRAAPDPRVRVQRSGGSPGSR